ncbi:hypothetical protein V8E36_003419 [Tilletia maclaganii]
MASPQEASPVEGTNGAASELKLAEPTGAASATGGMPNPSLYVKNIDSKVKKDELRRQLYALFGIYGRILDVVATKRGAMSGQAFVVFEDLAGATAALRGLSGFVFYDRPLSIEYARSKSRATVLQEKGPEGLFDQQ